MLSTRYGIIIANRRTGVVRRLTLSLRSVVIAVLVASVLPALMVVGSLHKAAWQEATLQAELDALRHENDVIRSATGALATQVSTLQRVIDDLARLDPSASERTAMARLPHRLQQDALGGLSPAAARAAVAGPTAAPDPMGVMRRMLSVLEQRLETARPRLERRAALARATPSIWPALGALSSGFGPRRDPFTAAASLHPGLDLDVQSGDPVHATADGIVSQAGYHAEYGNLVVIAHGFGIETRYAHLQRAVVRAGASVTRGRTIGHAGSTGRSTGAHLHYEVWIDGRAVDPLHYLVDRGPR